MQIFRLECALIRGRCFCEAGLKITTKHVSNSLVTHERFVVLFFLPSCCINSLMSGQNGDLAGLKLHSSVMLTSPPHSHSWTNSQILACKSYIFVSLCKHNHVHDWKMTQGLVSSPPSLTFWPVRNGKKFLWLVIVSGHRPKIILSPELFDKQFAFFHNNCRNWKRLLGVLWKWMLAVEERLFSSMETWQENFKSW